MSLLKMDDASGDYNPGLRNDLVLGPLTRVMDMLVLMSLIGTHTNDLVGLYHLLLLLDELLGDLCQVGVILHVPFVLSADFIA